MTEYSRDVQKPEKNRTDVKKNRNKKSDFLGIYKKRNKTASIFRYLFTLLNATTYDHTQPAPSYSLVTEVVM